MIEERKSFPELVWIYRYFYKTLPETLQFRFILSILRAHKESRIRYRKPFTPYFKNPTDYYDILVVIAMRNKDDYCQFPGRTMAHAMMKEFDPKSGVHERLTWFMNRCSKCKGSHIREAVLFAIQEQEPEFIKYLLWLFPANTRPGISATELVKFI